MFPQFKTWGQLLNDTNLIFKWDKLTKSEVELLYEKGLEYANRREYKKAGETFYKAASKAEKKNQQDDAHKMLYCAWECALKCGNPEPLAEFTYAVYEELNQQFPAWMIERLGMCGVAFVGYAQITEDKQLAALRYKMGGWLLTKYFDETGDFKNFEEEWIYYVFYACANLEIGGKEYLASYLYEMKKNVPEKYVLKVLKCLDEIIK